MSGKSEIDPFLHDRVVQVDQWLRDGKIAYSSRVIPVEKSLPAKQWVLPKAQVQEILSRARSIAVQPCVCRDHYRRCDHPVDVCLLLDDVADGSVEKGIARPVDMEEARGILRDASDAGLVHLSIYRPDHRIYALCSCCPCCCHDLQIVRRLGRKDFMVHAEYVAKPVSGACVECGVCLDRCAFEARIMRGGRLVVIPSACMGCGVCVPACPEKAIELGLRED